MRGGGVVVRVFTLALIGLTVVSPGGCITVGVGAGPRAETRWHALEAVAPPQETRAGAAAGKMIAVRSFTSRQRYDVRVVRRDPDGQVAFLENEMWAEVPADAVTTAVREALARSGAAAGVFDVLEGHTADLVLDGTVLAFDAVAAEKGPWNAHFALRLDVGDPASGRLLHSGVVEGQADLPGDGTAGLGAAMSRALAQAVGSALAEWRRAGVL